MDTKSAGSPRKTPALLKWSNEETDNFARECARLVRENQGQPLLSCAKQAQINTLPPERRKPFYGAQYFQRCRKLLLRIEHFFGGPIDLTSRPQRALPKQKPPKATRKYATKVLWTSEEILAVAKRTAMLRIEQIRPSLTELVNQAIQEVLPEERRRKILTLSNQTKLVETIENIFIEQVTTPSVPAAIEKIVEKPIYVRVVDDEIRVSVQDLWTAHRELLSLTQEIHNKVYFMPANGAHSKQPDKAADTRPLCGFFDLKIGVYGLMGHQAQIIEKKLEDRGIQIRDLYFYAADRDKTMKPPKPGSDRVFVCTKFINHPQVYQIEQHLEARSQLGYINGGIEATENAILDALAVARANSLLHANGNGNGRHHH